MTAALVVLGAVGLLALLPGLVGGVARTILCFALLLAPVGAFGWLLASSGRTIGATWLLLPLVAFIWLAVLDARFGVSARLARPPARVEGRGGGGEGDEGP